MPAEGQRDVNVVIVGAGLAGISAAIALKKQLGFENFTIYEKAASIGGTWRDNTYPGCSSDVPGHWYSLSTELNPNWSSYYVGQEEIRLYWQSIFDKHRLSTRTSFNSFVESSVWDEENQWYTVSVRNVVTREVIVVEAEVVIWAIGGFYSPFYPKDIPGAESFKGAVWHSARWRHDFDLRGKRVGVIGNGCSAAQFVPEISKDPSVEVVNFCRTPQWYVPKGNYKYPPWAKWVFRNVPLAMRMYRNFLMARADAGYVIFYKQNKMFLKGIREKLEKYLQFKAPKNELQNLIPNYPPGCKRLIVNPGYLEALHRPNVSLNWNMIKEIVEDGIKLKNGEVIALDAIIFGTGYSVEPNDLKVQGRNGITTGEYFDSKGGATSYLGSCIPGFPNHFTLLGPNVAVGHGSVIFSEEVQIDFAIKMIKPIIEGKVRSFEIREDVCDNYNDWLQKRLSGSVWSECTSYYQAGRGDNKRKIVVTFPGPVTLFWWLARKPQWENFISIGAENWTKERRMTRVKRDVLLVLMLLWGVVFSRGGLRTSLSFRTFSVFSCLQGFFS